MFIESAVWRAKSSGAKCSSTEIAELLTTETTDIESKSNDMLLWDLEKGGQGDENCRNVIREVTMDDFAKNEGGSSEDKENMMNRKKSG